MTLVHNEWFIKISNMAKNSHKVCITLYIVVVPCLACSVFVTHLADWNNSLQGLVNSGPPHTGVFSSPFRGRCHGVASVGAPHSRQSCQQLVHLVSESYGSRSALTVSGQPFLTATRTLLWVVHPSLRVPLAVQCTFLHFACICFTWQTDAPSIEARCHCGNQELENACWLKHVQI